jgi:hypothetical protein
LGYFFLPYRRRYGQRPGVVQPVKFNHDVAPSRGVGPLHIKLRQTLRLAKLDLYEGSGLKPFLRTMREYFSRGIIKAHEASLTKPWEDIARGEMG